MEENKFKSIEGYGQSFCHTCLSADRLLFPLGKYTDVYYNISCNFLTVNIPTKMVCWECAAILKKIKQFQLKVEHSQKLLLSYLAEKQTILPTLSSLTSTIIKSEKTINLDFDENIDNKTEIELYTSITTNENIAKKDEKHNLLDNIQVKEEKSDDDDYTMESNDLLDTIKTEEEENSINKPGTSCSKKNTVNKHNEFKYINKITSKELKRMCKISVVGFDEVKDLIKAKENCDLFNYRYKCHSCYLSWPRSEGYAAHSNKFHNKKASYVCDYCQCRFESKHELTGHVNSHRSVYACACGRRETRTRMELHLLRAHRVRCNVCDATFRTVRLFFHHYKEQHDKFICDYCGQKRTTKEFLEKHIIRNHADKHHCNKCNIDFKNYKSYESHIQLKHVVSGGEEAYCVECDRQFVNTRLYKRHVNETHRDKDGARKRQKCVCPECGKIYGRRETMRNHYNFVHLKKSNYVCKQCDVQFLNRSKYVDHLRFKHEGRERPKNKLCNICGRGFSNNKILTHHIRTHTGERPHACAHCPAAFAQDYAMRAHVAHVHLKIKRGTKIN